MGVISMTFKLTNAYSLCITISFELNDVSIYAINEKEVKDVGDNYALAGDILSEYYFYI